jgi:putative copper export protein
LKALIIINNFIHDLFTGLWASSLLVVYLLDAKARSPEGLLISPALHDVMRAFFWIGVGSIAVIFASGGLRLLYYRTEIAENGKLKKELLIVKHVLFTFIFIGGTYFAYLHSFS